MTTLITAYELSPALAKRIDTVEALTILDPILDAKRLNAVARTKAQQDTTAAIDVVHVIQQFYIAYKMDLLKNPDIVAALKDEDHFPTWKNYTELPSAPGEKEEIGRQAYHAHAPLDPLVMFFGDYSRGMAETVVKYCAENKDNADLWIDDRLFARRIMRHVDKDGAKRFGELMASRYEGTKRRIVIISETPSTPYLDEPANTAIENIRQTTFMTLMDKSGLWLNQKFTALILPTQRDAELDEIPFDQYVRLFFNMCNIDMAKIGAAHRVLIDMLNPGKTIRITNSDGTDVTFGIEGMTFVNSVADYNIPGTEVFTAPVRDQVNGTIVAKGWFNIPLSVEGRVRDITLEFKDGRIIRAEAAEGEHLLLEQINKDEGSHYLGELAFGTNPALKKHVSNGLLVEKIGGSFHVAIGKAYPNTPDAIINNGNNSMIHWDITTMLYGKNGKIYLDGKIIFENDGWLDPRLDYLNTV